MCGRRRRGPRGRGRRRLEGEEEAGVAGHVEGLVRVCGATVQVVVGLAGFRRGSGGAGGGGGGGD